MKNHLSPKSCRHFFVLYCASLLFNLQSYGQGPKADNEPPDKIPVLKIGELMPDAFLEMYGYANANARISDFRGKALILDFWATWCRPCVRDLPKLDSIQQVNKNDLNIVLVTRETKAVVGNFLKQVGGNISIGIPSVVNNSHLLKLFNISSLPQQVWIDKHGYIQAITYGEYLTDTNIKDLVNGQKPKVPLKKGGLRGKLPSAGKPLFSQENNKLDEKLILGYSLLTTYNESLAAAIGGNGPGEQTWGAAKTKLLFTNIPPITLFSIAYAPLLSDEFFALNQRIVFNTKDSLKYNYPSNITNMEAQEWNYSNTYCYDIMVPLRDTSRILEIMRNDLIRYFPLKPEIVTKEQECIQLSPTNDKTVFSTKGGKSARIFGQYYIKYENIPFQQLITDLNILLESKTPIINNISYKGNIDLELKGDLSNPQELAKALRVYNIATAIKLKSLTQLVLSDR